MIVETIIDALVDLVKVLFGWIDLPNMPEQMQSVLDTFCDIIHSGFGIIAVFLDMSYIAILVPIVVVIVNFEHIYQFIMWIIKKLPVSIE